MRKCLKLLVTVCTEGSHFPAGGDLTLNGALDALQQSATMPTPRFLASGQSKFSPCKNPRQLLGRYVAHIPAILYGEQHTLLAFGTAPVHSLSPPSLGTSSACTDH